MVSRSIRRLRAFAGPLLLLSTVLVHGCERPLVEARWSTAEPSPRVERPPAAAARTPAEPRRASPRRRGSAAEERLASRFDDAPAVSRFRGQASYYHDSLEGRPTASGQPYDPGMPTAAHRSLPFGTVVRVIRDDTRKVVYARINDRGPFVRGRVLDLSRSLAEELKMLRAGVVAVQVEVVELGPKRKSSAARKRKRR